MGNRSAGGHPGLVVRLHLDTDFAGDTDDACALAMVLGWPDVEIVGITTTADPGGFRAGYVASFLDLVGRTDIPVAAGADRSSTTLRPMGALPDHGRYWPSPVAPRPSPPGAVVDLLERSIEHGATVVAIGPYTNLAELEEDRPGRLDEVSIVVMGGCVRPPDAGLPAWGPEMDWNVQCDIRAAETVAKGADLTLVTLAATLKAHLRAAHLPRLVASGPLGRLLAAQASAHGDAHQMHAVGRSHESLPDDLLNFQYDPVACAVALGWTGAAIEEMRLRAVVEEGLLRFEAHPGGRRTRVVTDVDGEAFAELWLGCVEAAQREQASHRVPARPPGSRRKRA